MHLAEPKAATRTALITTPVVTKADALAVLDLLEHTDVALLVERLGRVLINPPCRRRR